MLAIENVLSPLFQLWFAIVSFSDIHSFILSKSYPGSTLGDQPSPSQPLIGLMDTVKHYLQDPRTCPSVEILKEHQFFTDLHDHAYFQSGLHITSTIVGAMENHITSYLATHRQPQLTIQFLPLPQDTPAPTPKGVVHPSTSSSAHRVPHRDGRRPPPKRP